MFVFVVCGTVTVNCKNLLYNLKLKCKSIICASDSKNQKKHVCTCCYL